MDIAASTLSISISCKTARFTCNLFELLPAQSRYPPYHNSNEKHGVPAHRHHGPLKGPRYQSGPVFGVHQESQG
jgi:hypothetical protein